VTKHPCKRELKKGEKQQVKTKSPRGLNQKKVKKPLKGEKRV